jgi:hypothetical protein
MCHVCDDRAFQAHAGVVPPEPAARRVVAVIEPVPRERREVDAANERDAVVDDDELLVMAVHRSFSRVELHLDPRALRELVAHRPHLATVGVEERQRGSGPGEHADVTAPGHVCEQVLQRRPAVAHAEVGREEPPCNVDMRLRGRDGLDHPRQRLGSVDEELGPRARTRRERAAGRPATWTGVERVVTATREPPAMVRADGALDARAERRVKAFEEWRGHAGYGTVAVVVAGGGAGGGGAGVEVVFGCGAGACVVVWVVVVDEGAYVYVGTYEYGEDTV